MKLSELMAGVPVSSEAAPELAQRKVTGLEYDSRKAAPGTVFFAFPGARVDGREFAADAVAKGALAVVSELEAPAGFGAPWIQVEHGRQALARAAKAFYGNLDERLRLTGITGTNGKT